MKLGREHILGGLGIALGAILTWWTCWVSGVLTTHSQATAPAAGKVDASPQVVSADTVRRQEAVHAYNRGRQCQGQQDYAAAIVHYQAALTNDPSMANAWFNLALIYAVRSNSVSARDAYENAIAAEPTMVAARYNLALMLLGEHDRQGALVQLREIVRLQPDNATAYYTLGYVLADDPLTVNQAKQAYTKFIALAPDDPGAANVREWLGRH